ncbi:MAG TPA: penicillin-binding transpeptidase domain-containing protein [Polyangia bacterium]|jgi:cell division protein FtsI/penicillin-binding protein 2
MRRLLVPRWLMALGIFALLAVVGAAAVALRRKPPLDWRRALAGSLAPRAENGRLVQPLADGGRVELTLDPDLQRAAERLLGDADPIQGAAVLVSVDDGRVLALAGRHRDAPTTNDARLATSAWAPAASVFKLVTTAALLGQGITPTTRVCYHGGVHSVEADNLEDHPELDARCKSLGYGVAKSQNAILARLAHDHLDPVKLERTARALGWGEAPAFELPTTASTLALPSDPLAFARVAAGFWNTSLSPLHGALLAATIARGGEMPALRIVDRVVDGAGHDQPLPARVAPHRALDADSADELRRMMVGTTEWGSANRAFRDSSTGRRRLAGVRVAGKTGTLTGREEGGLAYSWFIGFAPADHPQVAFAVLLGRADEADIRAAEVARALLATWMTSGDHAPAFVAAK